jgi:hypothetical protein
VKKPQHEPLVKKRKAVYAVYLPLITACGRRGFPLCFSASGLSANMKINKFILVLLFGLIKLTSFAIPMMNIRGGGHEKFDFYKTEGWLESDHAGSGFHLIRDQIRPNIWVRVFRYDTAISALAGLPNNLMAGQHIDWGNRLDTEQNPARDGDFYQLLRRVDFAQNLAVLNPSTGSCQGGGRCYGDWINNDLLWDPEQNDYSDKDGKSFFRFDNEINGKKRTRYRFTIFVEDNLPFWFKDKNHGYDLSSDRTESILYYPLSRVIVRITDKDNYNPAIDAAVNPDYNAYDSGPDEFFIEKQGEDLQVGKRPEEVRRINGKFIFNFQIIHSFRKSTDYWLTVVAIDMEKNRRVLHLPLSMTPLGGIQIQDRSSYLRRLD